MRFSARLLHGWLWLSPFDEHIQRLAPSMGRRRTTTILAACFAMETEIQVKE